MLGGKREMRVVFRQKGFDAIKRDSDGFKRLPGGDYSEVDFRGEGRYIFGEGSIIGDFKDLGNMTTIGECATIGDGNTIGKWATIGEFFTYGKNTTFEGGAVKNGRYVKVGQIGSENREAYFFIDENGKFFVRAGCWFSDMERFIERVKRVHGGTLFEKQYLAACEYARAVLPGMLEEAR